MTSFEQVVRQRHSTRAFDPARPVPEAQLLEVLELCRWTPSNCNAQPWRVFVVGGERCERLKRRLHATASSGTPVEENATPAFEGVHRQRQVACAVALYDKIGVARHDAEGRTRAALRNFEFFDAPHVAILCMDASFGVGVALDVGAYLQTFLLALAARGIASCAQASMRCYASVVKDELAIPDELRVMCGVSFGYELPEAAANQVRQSRAPLEQNVVLVGFDAAEESSSI